MNFVQAMQQVVEGKCITAASWEDPGIFVCIHDGYLRIKGTEPDGKYHPWMITEVDLYAADYAVVTGEVMVHHA